MGRFGQERTQGEGPSRRVTVTHTSATPRTCSDCPVLGFSGRRREWGPQAFPGALRSLRHTPPSALAPLPDPSPTVSPSGRGATSSPPFLQVGNRGPRAVRATLRRSNMGAPSLLQCKADGRRVATPIRPCPGQTSQVNPRAQTAPPKPSQHRPLAAPPIVQSGRPEEACPPLLHTCQLPGVLPTLCRCHEFLGGAYGLSRAGLLSPRRPRQPPVCPAQTHLLLGAPPGEPPLHPQVPKASALLTAGAPPRRTPRPTSTTFPYSGDPGV